MFRRIKGTQDFLDLSLFNFLIARARSHFATYHFNEIATPIIEPIDLFKRSLGSETDVVTKEMYTISADQSTQKICLRPEMTASTVRAFVENKIQHTPWKVFSQGPLFRHERPQKGRYRQFHQLNVEVVGSKSIAQDAQLISLLDRFFGDQLLLNNYALQINFLGCFEDRVAYKILLLDFLNGLESQLCATCMRRKDTNIMRIFDCKNSDCQILYRDAPQIAKNICFECLSEWEQLQEQLSLLSVSHVYQPTLVRGLDYYNKTVFEFSSNSLGAQNAFCGGGRYDQLVSQLGGKIDQPSVGAAIGIERLMLLLEPIKDQLCIPQKSILHCILPLSKQQESLALLVSDTLQRAGLCVDVLLEGDSVKSMMRKINRMGARWALLIGSDEQQGHSVMVKNMYIGSSELVKQIDLVTYLSQ